MSRTRKTLGQPTLDFQGCDEPLAGESRQVAIESVQLPATTQSTGLTAFLMEQVVELANMDRALRKVVSNGGSPGIDGMAVEDLVPYVEAHLSEVSRSLLTGVYRPKPVKRVTIPKPGGGERTLGIPTVLDRFVQQAILQVLTPLIDPTFSDSSYGFRPGRNAHQAVEAAREFAASGLSWVVDIDIEKFFDRVNHDVLMGRLAKRMEDKRLLKLIRAFLNAGVMLNGVKVDTEEGTPQGGPLSPLLANILLDDWDKELESRKLHFVRYADDCNIYVSSERAAQRVMSSVTQYLEVRLRLRVNRVKSAVGSPAERRFPRIPD